jgi:hypothetical protein
MIVSVKCGRWVSSGRGSVSFFGKRRFDITPKEAPFSEKAKRKEEDFGREAGVVLNSFLLLFYVNVERSSGCRRSGGSRREKSDGQEVK